ncbi:MAG: VTT domain-containing protein [Planctomycetes bacterium]|jgi:membrane protein DedA with SNARE-associated domain|nr:VTT domain-containing protein [Planctomycetota bacterium]MCL4730329.1 VTT domain-containing protein [Planctomycetota bacterium]
MDWETVKDYVATYGYWAVALGTLWDQSGLQAFVVAGGVLASMTGRLSLTLVALSGAAGGLTSDLALFAVGRWRAAWLERVMRSDKNRMRLVVLQQGVRRWGWLLLTLGRFLPWLGRFVPAAAGLRRYGTFKAVFFSALGSLVSASLYASLGYWAAESLGWFDDYALWIGLGALAVSFPVAAWLLKRFDKLVEARLAADSAALNGDVPLDAGKP